MFIYFISKQKLLKYNCGKNRANPWFIATHFWHSLVLTTKVCSNEPRIPSLWTAVIILSAVVMPNEHLQQFANCTYYPCFFGKTRKMVQQFAKALASFSWFAIRGISRANLRASDGLPSRWRLISHALLEFSTARPNKRSRRHVLTWTPPTPIRLVAVLRAHPRHEVLLEHLGAALVRSGNTIVVLKYTTIVLQRRDHKDLDWRRWAPSFLEDFLRGIFLAELAA